ncbi:MULTISPECIES: pyridoxamine 5'-phosphate oxidase family protein [Streptomyces]|uniref:pyridoxamine 5'-phosphate oxidase family protein n=1 Tax=Streptomyces TaxID=1883 RepID=UPI0022AA26F5|nr:pyridoxamine 5'-phosphate oxidase family protein [Streptomyces sp. HB2AG]MCZ2525011.1 pyridoxamine 5'-phosphate oxidase family protein [Streptomyces sp. HB2AG]
MHDGAQQPPPQVTAAELTSMADRTGRLLDGARYLNLATVSPGGRPWVATLEYAWLGDPLRFLFGSAVGSRHSRDIASSPLVGGSLFLAGNGTGLDVAAVDGAQFTGTCSEVGAHDLDRYRPVFYEAVFPDERERARWMLPKSSLREPAEHRLYLVEVERWWLVDTRTWEQDRVDRRMELPLAELDARVVSTKSTGRCSGRGTPSRGD